MLERIITLEGGDLVTCRLGELTPGDGGKVLEVSLRLTGVLPERRTAVEVELAEEDGAGGAYPRGVRVLAIPAHHGPGPRDLEAGPVRFYLPGALDASGDGVRRLTVRADAHYIDGNARSLLDQT